MNEANKPTNNNRKKITMPLVLLIVGLFLGLSACDTDPIDDEFGQLVSGNHTEVQPEDPTDGTELEEDQTEPTEPTEPDVTEIRLQFGGDVFIHQGPLDVARTGENTFDFRPFFTHIRPFLDGDFVMANMESPVDAFGNNQSVAGWPYFNAPFEILDGLIYAGFNHMSTANNHAFDKGFEGLLNTVQSFERAGLTHTGLNVDMDDFNTPTIIDVNGIQVGILAYTDVINNQGWALMPQSNWEFAVRRFESLNLNDMPRMVADIADLRAAGAELVVVSLHWGEEYVDEPTQMQRLIAAELSEAGADIIMGHHSKTVQPVEWHYREDGTRSLIMYSLGNFMVDQTRLFQNATTPNEVLYEGWNSGANTYFAGRTQFGMLVSLQVTKDSYGNITLGAADVLPTLCMRDFNGNTLGTIDGVSIMPLVGGELPDFVTDEEVRNWGRVAYEHIVSVVGRELIRTND